MKSSTPAARQRRLAIAWRPRQRNGFRARGFDRLGECLGSFDIGFGRAAKARKRRSARPKPPDGVPGACRLAVVDRLEAASVKPFSRLRDAIGCARVRVQARRDRLLDASPSSGASHRRRRAVARMAPRGESGQAPRRRGRMIGDRGAPGAISTLASAGSACTLTPVMGVVSRATPRLSDRSGA